MAQHFHVPLADRDQPPRDHCHQQQPQAQHRDIAVRQHRRDQEMPAPDRDAMDEDHRHGVFQHRERQRTEEQHRAEQDPADRGAGAQERRQLGHQRAGLSGHDPLEVARQRRQQQLRVDHMRQRDHHQDQQRHDRQQRVVGHRSGQQQALVGAELDQRAPQEAPRMTEQVADAGVEKLHGGHRRVQVPTLCVGGRPSAGPRRRDARAANTQ